MTRGHVLQFTFGTNTALSLARWMWQLADSQPDALAAQVLFIPSLRLKKQLYAALLETSGREALPLPRIIGLGELDDDAPELDEALGSLPAIIPPVQRRHLLARQVLAWLEKRRQHALPEHGLLMAEGLAALLDEMGREGIDLKKLESLVEGDLARHWHENRDFLAIISQHWPAILADQHRVEPATRLWQAVQAYEELWRKQPPHTPVIVAGSTGSAPATRRLMKAVLALPQGHVVLPALDAHMGRIEGSMPGSHPMCILKHLLDDIGIAAPDVPLLGERPAFAVNRADVASAMFWPAEEPSPPPAHTAAPEGIAMAEAEHEHGEARLVALLMLEGLHAHPGGLTALVTPDRALARRVSAELACHGMLVDDGAAQPVAQMPAARFLCLALALVCSLRGDEGHAPEALLALLKHPLAGMGLSPAECRRAARELERLVLRQRASMESWQSIRNLAKASRLGHDATALLEQLDLLLGAWPEGDRPQDGMAWFERHIALCEAMAATDEEPGPTRLWGDAHGSQLQESLRAFASALPVMGHVSLGTYRAALEHHLAAATYRPVVAAHPHLLIIGPLEARLITASRVIAAGMNEGSWPASITPSPWLNRTMRRQLGLPPVEQKLGLAAHDIWRLLEMPEVIFTRARRTGRAPAIPSRWWERLAALVPDTDRSAHYAHWLEQLEHKPVNEFGHEPRPKPSATPPVEARPDAMYATGLEWLRHHPYAYYARHVLKLRPLEAIGQEMGESDYGMWLHDVMLDYHKAQIAGKPGGVAAMEAIGDALLPKARLAPQQGERWLERLRLMAPVLCAVDASRRARAKRMLAEAEGSITRELGQRRITIKARADRLEQWNDGRLSVVDYKTGSIPTRADVEKHRALQLAAEAWIASEGGYDELGRPAPGELWYWPLKTHLADEADGTIFTVDEAFLQATGAFMDVLLEHYLCSENAFTPPDKAETGFSPFIDEAYRQLAREGEW
jgi:ATP-dependent helicase/nuclease subunit B